MPGTTAFEVPQDLVAPSLRSASPSRDFKCGKPRVTYPNLYVDNLFT